MAEMDRRSAAFRVRPLVITLGLIFLSHLLLDGWGIWRLYALRATDSFSPQTSSGKLAVVPIGRRDGELLRLRSSGEDLDFSCAAPGVLSTHRCVTWERRLDGASARIDWIWMPSGLIAGKVRRPIRVALEDRVLLDTEVRALLDREVRTQLKLVAFFACLYLLILWLVPREPSLARARSSAT
jgi:integrase